MKGYDNAFSYKKKTRKINNTWKQEHAKVAELVDAYA